MPKQFTTVLDDELAKKFEEMCQSRNQTAYSCLKDMVEFLVGEKEQFEQGTAQEALKTMKRPDWMKQSTTDKMMARWRLEGRFNNVVPPGEHQ